MKSPLTQAEAIRLASIFAKPNPAAQQPTKPKHALPCWERITNALILGHSTVSAISRSSDTSIENARQQLKRMLRVGRVKLIHVGRPGRNDDPTVWGLVEDRHEKAS